MGMQLKVQGRVKLGGWLNWRRPVSLDIQPWSDLWFLANFSANASQTADSLRILIFTTFSSPHHVYFLIDWLNGLFWASSHLRILPSLVCCVSCRVSCICIASSTRAQNCKIFPDVIKRVMDFGALHSFLPESYNDPPVWWVLIGILDLKSNKVRCWVSISLGLWFKNWSWDLGVMVIIGGGLAWRDLCLLLNFLLLFSII